MSRRARRSRGNPARVGREHAAGAGDRGGRAGGEAAPPVAPSRRILPDLAILTAVFAVTVLVAELAGAANLGVALGVGQVAFALALAVLLSRR